MTDTPEPNPHSSWWGSLKRLISSGFKLNHHGSWWGHMNEFAYCHWSIDQVHNQEDFDRWNQRVSPWQPIETAPKDATAFLAYGRHTHSPDDAQRGVVAGDHWWAIIVWDAWREPHQWVFAKDGKPTWSEPTHYMPLPEPPEVKK